MTLNFKKIRKNNEIKICCWNIHGTKSQIIDDKLLDTEFIKKLKNSDIVSLTELHTEEKDLFIPGYRLLKQKIRKKTHKGPKIGGGIAVFAKEDLCVPNTSEDSIWIRLGEKSVGGGGGDVFIGSYYVSPENKKSKHNLFNILNDEIKKINDKGDIIIQGDFNARTGQKTILFGLMHFLRTFLVVLKQRVSCRRGTLRIAARMRGVTSYSISARPTSSR